MNATTPSTPGAIFLSYAHEDTDAARRIAEALRSQGMEVWFDQSELRGGEAWDAKIRKQIHECSLFLAVVSEHTQARTEGYFRREWKLAVERTSDMAAGVAFLVPVVIDDTAEAQAIVPDEFMRVQWTRLPGALPTPQFVEQVKRLLAGPKQAGGRDRLIPPQSAKAGFGDPALQRKSGLPAWMWGAVAVGVIAIAAFLVIRQPEPPAALPKTMAEAKPATPVISEKSIAVLPFSNMSENKEANAFFSDGIHEDILTNLALIREFRVVSRTSVMQYRTTNKPIRQIAAELGVAYILEGSVRRAGDRIRVTGQLIDARTDGHLWANTYDRNLSDVFALQSELAREIAGALQTVISPEEKALLELRPTGNPAAYDMYLKAREAFNRSRASRNSLERQEAFLQASVALDARFADAWAELARAHAAVFFQNYERTPGRLEKAGSAMDRALALAPDSPEVIRNRGYYLFYAHRQYDRAIEQFEKVRGLRPNDPELLTSIGEVRHRQGKWLEAMASFRRAVELDPGNRDYSGNLSGLLVAGRRYEEAIAELRRITRVHPESVYERWSLAFLHFVASGSRTEAEAFLSRFAPDQEIERRKTWAVESGNYAEAIRLARLHPPSGSAMGGQSTIGTALAFAAHGDVDGARTFAEPFRTRWRARLAAEPENTDILWQLAMIEAVMGNREEALRSVRRAVDLAPEALDAVTGPAVRNKLALVYAWTGETDRAVEETTRLLLQPCIHGFVNPMRHDPWWFPLRGDPRFEALLADPKNNAPLF